MLSRICTEVHYLRFHDTQLCRVLFRISILSTFLLLPHSPLSLSLTTRTMPLDAYLPDIPPHWLVRREDYPLLQYYFQRFISIISWGDGNMAHLWGVCCPGCSSELWEKETEMVIKRLDRVNIVVRIFSSLDFDRCSMGFDCDFWPRPVYSFLRQWDFVPPSPLGKYHIRGHFPIASFCRPSSSPSLA